MSRDEIGRADLYNIVRMTDTELDEIPDAFFTEFLVRLKMQHRIQIGPMQTSTLLALCIDMGFTKAGKDKPPGEVIRWQYVAEGSPVWYRESSDSEEELEGTYKGGVAYGTIAVQPKKGAVLELSPGLVRLRVEKKQGDRGEKIIEERKETNWPMIPQGTPVLHKRGAVKQKGTLFGYHKVAEQDPILTIKVGDRTKDVPACEVVLWAE